jgi:hypothetical protein
MFPVISTLSITHRNATNIFRKYGKPWRKLRTPEIAANAMNNKGVSEIISLLDIYLASPVKTIVRI